MLKSILVFALTVLCATSAMAYPETHVSRDLNTIPHRDLTTLVDVLIARRDSLGEEMSNLHRRGVALDALVDDLLARRDLGGTKSMPATSTNADNGYQSVHLTQAQLAERRKLRKQSTPGAGANVCSLGRPLSTPQTGLQCHQNKDAIALLTPDGKCHPGARMKIGAASTKTGQCIVKNDLSTGK
ncbi:hypothetical protein Hypma_007092 [Hypsizygus marmoreus]|uniref:Secreted protein n=1 Tax=Hypsizygus marmoreus TaxID=39966 RepID=A0A369KAD0_HYPMA|nr:hypothetical protein Hypma_007092 [Hypsizygus marmoreus]